MRILREQSSALIIDMQERLFPHIHKHDQLEKNTGILIKGLKAMNIPLLVTEQYRKGLGITIPAIRDVLEGHPSIEKTCFSCCDDNDFESQLKKIGRKNILIAGIETHVCVLQTVTDLLGLGYQPVIIEDCVSSRKESDKLTAIERMRQEGAIISSYESILFELLRVSGTDEFKTVSALVK